jgi:transcriptional regulator with XRE-family HTH domain
MMVLYEDPRIRNIKSKLKKARIIRGYTQEALASLSEVNIKSIAAYEQNPAKLSSASSGTLYKLADALGVEMEEILNKDYID